MKIVIRHHLEIYSIMLRNSLIREMSFKVNSAANSGSTKQFGLDSAINALIRAAVVIIAANIAARLLVKSRGNPDG